MVFIKNFINKIKDKFKTEGSFREAIIPKTHHLRFDKIQRKLWLFITSPGH